MSNSQVSQDKTRVTFTYRDDCRAEEIIALKILIFGIIRSLPHDIAINSIKNISANHENPALNNLCTEMVDAIIATTKIVD
ncbi:hypothetical protein DK562_21830 [Salmonella enterica]|nr:hypothetical protein [Salmonella enterica]EBS1478588.1 hypothetical protein [Salmonella enterica subsp. enterica serovar Saintpaul]EBY5178155.1 hypothetical protein [Salmonella enterica subsp. enterica serovar Saintpaul]ECI4210187.1 hypothetical protein [Salmonella enterica subsp. enterica]EJJ1299932.1 hypothetical protein [Salmonella enterica]